MLDKPNCLMMDGWFDGSLLSGVGSTPTEGTTLNVLYGFDIILCLTSIVCGLFSIKAYVVKTFYSISNLNNLLRFQIQFSRQRPKIIPHYITITPKRPD